MPFLDFFLGYLVRHFFGLQVETILRVTRRLSHCNLSSNALGGHHEFGSGFGLPAMRTLVLIATDVAWPTLFRLLKAMP